MDGPPPPPPPPHGANPKSSNGSGLPPGNYDIFIIPPHSSGGGFVYLPSLQPQRNSFLAGVACTLLAIGVWTIVEPVVKQWFASTIANMSGGGGGGGMVLLVIGVGIAGWAWGKTQSERPVAGSEDGPRGSPAGGASPRPGAGSHTHSGGYQQRGDGFAGGGSPPQNPGGGPGYGPPPNTHHHHQRQHEQWPPPPPPPPRPPSPPFSEPDANPKSPPKSPPKPESNRSSSASWEKAREETRKREEERKRQAEEKKRQEEEERKRKEAEQAAKAAEEKKKWETARAREKEAAARAQRERSAQERVKKLREEQEAKEKEAREKLEREIREKVEAEAAAVKAKEDAERAKADAEKAAKAKADVDRAERLKAVRERAEKAKQEREAAAKAKAAAAAQASHDASAPKPPAPPSIRSPPSTRFPPSTKTYGVGERTDPYAPAPPPPRVPYEKPSAKSYIGTDSPSAFRPYDAATPQQRPNHAKSTSSFSSSYTSSYAPSATTARTTPPPSHRGPYSTSDPDKIVIKAVYLFSNLFPKPVAELVAGVDRVTDGLILRMTTEGLFIDDDVRDVAQREWDVKAWTVKAVEVFCPKAPAGLLPVGSGEREGGKEHAGLRFFSGQTGGNGGPGKVSPEDTDLAVEKLLRSCKASCSGGVAGDQKSGLHVLRATIKDQEGRKYVFLIDETEGWKVAVGLQRMRRGSMVRGMAVVGMPAMEVRRLAAFWTPPQ
ncbi:hypothetical protein H2201_001581 [Coniosporium apollinis]|uniref:Uncharacterized protein n=1 Tax=Coniosporium apollinis TaxID=61459 RepID=A0ABQ9P712_9PEZI|nr:hypothetical protein H2201_001581 [Coniosporium apollinis]